MAKGQPSWLESSLSDDGIWSLRDDLPVLKVLDEQREELAHLTPREALAVAISNSGILDRVMSWKNPLDRIANLDALRGLAAQYEDEARTLRSAATAAGLVVWLTSLARVERRTAGEHRPGCGQRADLSPVQGS